MNITFSCPKCDADARLNVSTLDKQFVCPHCQQAIRIPEGAYHDGSLDRCLVCPSTDLYVRKDFPQRLGVALVAVGVVGSSIAWAYTNIFWTFGILFATALIDVVLYMIVGDSLMCYRCQAQYRQLEDMGRHEGFNLETHERYRQLDARLADQSKNSSGPATAEESQLPLTPSNLNGPGA